MVFICKIWDKVKVAKYKTKCFEHLFFCGLRSGDLSIIVAVKYGDTEKSKYSKD